MGKSREMGNKKKGYNSKGAKEKKAEEWIGDEVGDDSGTVKTHTHRQANMA